MNAGFWGRACSRLLTKNKKQEREIENLKKEIQLLEHCVLDYAVIRDIKYHEENFGRWDKSEEKLIEAWACREGLTETQVISYGKKARKTLEELENGE